MGDGAAATEKESESLGVNVATAYAHHTVSANVRAVRQRPRLSQSRKWVRCTAPATRVIPAQALARRASAAGMSVLGFRADSCCNAVSDAMAEIVSGALVGGTK